MTFNSKDEIIIFVERIAVLPATLKLLSPPTAFIHPSYEVAFRAFETLETGPIMKHRVAAKKLSKFDAKTFLSTVDGGRKIAEFSNKQAIFVQDDSSDAVFYIQKGKVRLTVVSKSGKEATIGILNEGDFFGEGCLAEQTLRLFSATAMTDCSVMRIDKKYMMEVLHREPALSDMFVAYLLTRNVRYEEDLVDQLFNSSEKRLARMLLLLARFGKDGKPESVIPKISQETLAEMVGTTRSRINFFMNKFREMGFIEYNSEELQVHSSLLNVVLHD
ncbi:MAG TPA: Crp/Fnr family transcriptional regulator [Terriglobales bacterium]|nr:Crp/Fnr family transcriptional regulator [Terriglobales bacterium]